VTPADVSNLNAVIAPIESPQYVAFVVTVKKWVWSDAGYRCLYQSVNSGGICRPPGSLNDGVADGCGVVPEWTEMLGGLATQIKTSAFGLSIGPQASARIGATTECVELIPRLAPLSI